MRDKLTNATFFKSDSFTLSALRHVKYESAIAHTKGQVFGLNKLNNRYVLAELNCEQTQEVVAVPVSIFWMGVAQSECHTVTPESPCHSVSTPVFFISTYPVTQAQWAAVAALPRVARELDLSPSHSQGAHHPVGSVPSIRVQVMKVLSSVRRKLWY